MSPDSDREPMRALSKDYITKVQPGELFSFIELRTELLVKITYRNRDDSSVAV